MNSLFPSIVKTVPEGVLGAARVTHFNISKSDSRLTAFRPAEYVPDGRYASLYVENQLVMSDTPMEHRTNYEVVRRARGSVLVAGLGLGMILRPILDKPEVASLTVVEKSADVIELVAPHYADPRLSVVNADIFEWKPVKGTKYDCIYFDIWPDKCSDYLEEMAKLHQRFKSYKAPGAWMDSWCRDEMKAHKRRYGW